MTIDKWIALGACIAAFVSALAALLAVKQAVLQRKLSYKPQILLRPQFFDYEFDNNKLDILNQVKFRDSNNLSLNKSDLAVNIGLGAALEIVISWDVDTDDVINRLNSYFATLKKQIKLTRYMNGVSLDYSTDNKDFILVRENTSERVDYILSYNQKPSPTDIIFPYAYISMACASFIFSLDAEGRVIKLSTRPEVKFEYKDIGGEIYQDEYYINVEIGHFTKGPYTTKMVGYMTFDKKHSHNKTANGLERIRKSYAHFIEKIKIF
ncbi:hypothetical protein [Kosakonia sacchari]|uniref:hypothetical protein n=1 Tax=Kosakonia sacchari TaxID=1158459 RepID=UPI0015856A5B|nr:hypothetical protein [Kosakonia sacchari]NUL39421.1 hypothetical protein [Kosakonia sacchari]